MAYLLWFLFFALKATATTFDDQGPYSFANIHWKHGVPLNSESKEKPYTLDFTLTFPSGDKDKAFPLVFFFSGWELRAKYYGDYARRLASWGYVVVQYDVPMLPLINDRTEVTFFPEVLNWIAREWRLSDIPVDVDFNRIAVGGHSRGAKLACLIAASHSNIDAVFLVDPVDGDGKHAHGPDYPSAVKALEGRKFKMAIAGSSISGSCNPTEYNYLHFWKMAGEGSWLSVVSKAGHCQFLHAPPAQQWFLNLLCHSGHTTSQDVIDSTVPSLVAWLESIFRSDTMNSESHVMSRLEEFFAWVRGKEDKGDLKFYVKEDITYEM